MKDKYDVVIAGGGPGGLACGMYSARGGLCALIIDRGLPGGQMAMSEWVENYPGFPDGIKGEELSELMVKHAKNFGVELEYGNIIGISEKKEDDCRITIKLDDDTEVKAFAFVIATGAQPKRLGTPGEIRLNGRGISYCAICDGNFFKGKEVCVIGGGDAAVEEAVYLSKLCSKVTIIHRRDSFRATRTAVAAAESRENIFFKLNTQTLDFVGDEKVEGVEVKDLKTGETRIIPCGGVFVYVGITPISEISGGQIELDKLGFIKTDENMETSYKGVYAIGDVRRPNYRQIATAVSDGITAALAIDIAIQSKPDRWR